MKRRPDAASRRPRVASSRDASRDARPPHTHTHTRVSCNTHDDDSIRCAFSTIRFAFSLDREYPSHCLPTHTKTHIDAPNRESRAQSRARSIDRRRRSMASIASRISSMHVIDENVVIDRWRMDAIDRDTRRRRCDGATDEDARECACVCRDAPHVDVCLRRRSRRARRDGRSESRTRIARTRRTDRRTETRKDTVIVTRH